MLLWSSIAQHKSGREKTWKGGSENKLAQKRKRKMEKRKTDKQEQGEKCDQRTQARREEMGRIQKWYKGEMDREDTETEPLVSTKKVHDNRKMSRYSHAQQILQISHQC